MAETWNKKEREKKKQQSKREKAERMQERKDNPKAKSMDDMMAYIDENGNISATPPDPKKMRKVKLEDIEIGVPRHEEMSAEDMVRRGTVTFFNNDKGYGFIKDAENQQSVFVHINSLKDEVNEGSKVIFEIEMGPKGANAVNVRKAPPVVQ